MGIYSWKKKTGHKPTTGTHHHQGVHRSGNNPIGAAASRMHHCVVRASNLRQYQYCPVSVHHHSVMIIMIMIHNNDNDNDS